MKPIKVLIVDDSAFMRKFLAEALLDDPAIEVAGHARTGKEALDKVTADIDVVTMDIEMPDMDGLAAVRRIRERKLPCRIIMVSALTDVGADTTLQALKAGAEEFILKPREMTPPVAAAFRQDLTYKIRELGVRRRLVAAAKDMPRAASMAARLERVHIDLVVIGASTGGPSALRTILSEIPADFPVPIAIAQHMPPLFTAHLAADLSSAAKVKVIEAREGMYLSAGTAVVAPGGSNLKLLRRNAGFKCTLDKPDNGIQPVPSVDALFQSLAQAADQVLAVILTGIGSDGAAGMLELKRQGAITVAQDASTSVVYGMPRAALEKGGVDEVVVLPRIAERLIAYVGATRRCNS
ncbi:MAG: hypothetical protein A3G34_00490 [Candidatus Lindowbacteria bacterium RIFCSPLOWO2_12_FULL_62_27]|nr:MAG: hypothetical protein A3G34_00490 [Candidatus Lindowbacteria bacterium RIFCSPLOWO2_12_FULL_62_27]OGH58206.1 MAG: hypothetical protein A3I06_01070 [Candidatus Lindowbacteria bacterium RIFCSPLOWO2_02_FULL_62_12]